MYEDAMFGLERKWGFLVYGVTQRSLMGTIVEKVWKKKKTFPHLVCSAKKSKLWIDFFTVLWKPFPMADQTHVIRIGSLSTTQSFPICTWFSHLLLVLTFSYPLVLARLHLSPNRDLTDIGLNLGSILDM